MDELNGIQMNGLKDIRASKSSIGLYHYPLILFIFNISKRFELFPLFDTFKFNIRHNLTFINQNEQ